MQFHFPNVSWFGVGEDKCSETLAIPSYSYIRVNKACTYLHSKESWSAINDLLKIKIKTIFSNWVFFCLLSYCLNSPLKKSKCLSGRCLDTPYHTLKEILTPPSKLFHIATPKPKEKQQIKKLFAQINHYFLACIGGK